MNTIIKHLQCLLINPLLNRGNLVDVSPHFPSVIHSTIKHIHHIQKIMTIHNVSLHCGYRVPIPIKSHLSDFGHVGAFWAPCIIACGLSYFDLSIRVSFRNILPNATSALSDTINFENTLNELPFS